MSITPIVDVAIGLIFVYLLLGLITTAVQEMLVSFISLRGRLLRSAIADLVAGGNEADGLFTSVFHHPLVATTSATKLPSYLPSRTFALAVIDVLSNTGPLPVFSQIEHGLATLPPGATRDSLTLLVRDAAGDLDVLKTSIATWFDDAMDRLSGVYKRWSQYFAIGLGALLAVGLNVDSVNLANRLWHDEALRSSVVTSATAFAAAHQQSQGADPKSQDAQTAQAQSDLTKDVSTLNQLSIPIGWDNVQHCVPATVKGAPPLQKGDPCKAQASYQPGTLGYWFWSIEVYFWHLGLGGFLLVLLGWVITAIATSLGAPFWFDMLQNILNLRGAGPKPAKADGTGGDT